jgi:hypothetical protein
MELTEIWEYALDCASNSKVVYTIVGLLLKSREISKENLRKIKQALDDMECNLCQRRTVTFVMNFFVCCNSIDAGAAPISS